VDHSPLWLHHHNNDPKKKKNKPLVQQQGGVLKKKNVLKVFISLYIWDKITDWLKS
jgi:hypothetical protein